MTALEYSKLNDRLSQYSTLFAALEAAEAEIKTIQLAAAGELLPKHAEAKIKLANLEAELRVISDGFYAELFPENKKRTHQTPFGGIRYHKSTTLEFDDEEKSVLKIHRDCEEEEARAAHDRRPALFTSDQLLRTKVTLNLEALEALPDAQLAAWDIRREKKDNFKVLPFAMQTDSPARKPAKKKEAK